MFGPVAPGGNLTPAQTPNRRGAAAPAPAQMPQVNTPGRRRERVQAIDFHDGGHNRLGRCDGMQWNQSGMEVRRGPMWSDAIRG
jgi:hypothetical protein